MKIHYLFPSILFTFEIVVAQNKPNIVFVFTDQQSSDMLGCYGNKDVITPNIDQLSAEGIRLTNSVVNQPVSTPTRSMLITGQHPLRNGSLKNDYQLIANNGTTIAQALKNDGYNTAYIGKWHLYGGNRNRPVPVGEHRHGFDLFLTNNCTLDFSPEVAFYYDPVTGSPIKFNKWEVYGQTDQAVEYIRNAPADKPFALFVSFHPPHDQGTVKRYNTIPELMNKYNRDTIEIRSNVKLTGSALENLKTDYHGYYAMCTGVDIAVGRIIDELKSTNQYDNTIFVYTSDHGDNLSSHNRPWAKSNPENEAIKVPFIIKWKNKIPSGSTSDVLLGTLDVMPTLLGLTNTTLPETCQGINLAPELLGYDQIAPKSVPLFYFNPGWRGVYTNRYTFAFDELANHSQSYNVLYDRIKDPLQMNNLFYSAGYKSVRDSLFQVTLEWMNKFEDTMISDADMTNICGDAETTGILPGRPVDLIKSAGKRSRIPVMLDDIQDSIRALIKTDTLYIYKGGEVISVFFTTDIDSISFKNNFTEKVVDADGNIYQTIKIGNQVWMMENLQTTRYRNGDKIQNIDGGDFMSVNNEAWKAVTEGAYSYWLNNPSKKELGLYYNKYVIDDSREIAPDGWRIPTREDFQTLINFVGGNNQSGSDKLKKDDAYYWNIPGNNSSQFSGLGVGIRASSDGIFKYFGATSSYWTSTKNSSNSSLNLIFKLTNTNIFFDNNGYANSGCVIRCIKK
jgi:uncharacterized protein (TIGR02145 family)